MPIYTYKCDHCGKTAEVLHLKDKTPPNCHGPMSRTIGKCSFVLKGNGWYATEYGKDINKRDGHLDPQVRGTLHPGSRPDSITIDDKEE